MDRGGKFPRTFIFNVAVTVIGIVGLIVMIVELLEHKKSPPPKQCETMTIQKLLDTELQQAIVDGCNEVCDKNSGQLMRWKGKTTYDAISKNLGPQTCSDSKCSLYKDRICKYGGEYPKNCTYDQWLANDCQSKCVIWAKQIAITKILPPPGKPLSTASSGTPTYLNTGPGPYPACGYLQQTRQFDGDSEHNTSPSCKNTVMDHNGPIFPGQYSKGMTLTVSRDDQCTTQGTAQGCNMVTTCPSDNYAVFGDKLGNMISRCFYELVQTKENKYTEMNYKSTMLPTLSGIGLIHKEQPANLQDITQFYCYASNGGDTKIAPYVSDVFTVSSDRFQWPLTPSSIHENKNLIRSLEAFFWMYVSVYLLKGIFDFSVYARNTWNEPLFSNSNSDATPKFSKARAQSLAKR